MLIGFSPEHYQLHHFHVISYQVLITHSAPDEVLGLSDELS